MKIRLAKETDIPNIANLWEKMVHELYPDNTPDKEVWIEYCTRLFDSGLYYIYVAEDKGKVIGFIDAMKYLEPSTGNEHGVCQLLYIEPEYRKSLVAFRLHRTMYKMFKSFGVKTFEFFCGTKDIDVWIKKGYEPMRIMFRRVYV